MLKSEFFLFSVCCLNYSFLLCGKLNALHVSVQYKRNIYMSAFGVYFLVLTAALVFYYIIVVVMDLFKKSKKGRSDSEEIEVDDDDELRSVVETDDGFDVSVGDKSVVSPVDSSSDDEPILSDEEEEDYVTDDELATMVDEENFTDDEQADDGSGMSSPDVDETLADIRQQMDDYLDDGSQEYQEVMDSTSFEVMMEQPRKLSASSKILKTFESD